MRYLIKPTKNNTTLRWVKLEDDKLIILGTNETITLSNIIKTRIFPHWISIYYIVDSKSKSVKIKNHKSLRRWLSPIFDLRLVISIFSGIVIFSLSMIFLGVNRFVYHLLYASFTWLTFFYFIGSLNKSLKITNARFAFIGVLVTLPFATLNSIFLVCLLAFGIIFLLSILLLSRATYEQTTPKFLFMLYWLILNIVSISGYSTFTGFQLKYTIHKNFIDLNKLKLINKPQLFTIADFSWRKPLNMNITEINSFERFIQNQNVLLEKMPFVQTYKWKYPLMFIDGAFTVLPHSPQKNLNQLHDELLTYASTYFHTVNKKSVSKVKEFSGKNNKKYWGLSFTSYNRISRKLILQHCLATNVQLKNSILFCFNSSQIQNKKYYFNFLENNRM